MYRSLNDFTAEWQQESSLTMKILETLTDDSLHQEAVPGHWSVGKLGWHLVGSFEGIMKTAGLEFEAPDHTKVPSSAQEIADGYRKTNEAFLQALNSQWNDATLQERKLMWGFKDMSMSEVLKMLVMHQAHHRGQMTVLMRQAGLVVPGVYGPSQEEWAAMQAAHK